MTAIPPPRLRAVPAMNGKTALVTCPWCGRNHRHPTPPGEVHRLRSSHCVGGPRGSGYVIVLPGEEAA